MNGGRDGVGRRSFVSQNGGGGGRGNGSAAAAV